MLWRHYIVHEANQRTMIAEQNSTQSSNIMTENIVPLPVLRRPDMWLPGCQKKIKKQFTLYSHNECTAASPLFNHFATK